MSDEELNALVTRLDDMSDLSRDHAAGLLDLGHKVAVNQAITAITTLRECEARLRAQLAEAVKAERQTYKDCVETNARADRAEQRVATLEAALAEAREERDDYAYKLMQANNTYTEMHLEIERLRDKLAAKGVK